MKRFKPPICPLCGLTMKRTQEKLTAGYFYVRVYCPNWLHTFHVFSMIHGEITRSLFVSGSSLNKSKEQARAEARRKALYDAQTAISEWEVILHDVQIP